MADQRSLEALRDIALATGSLGQPFFGDLAVALTNSLKVRWAMVGERVGPDGSWIAARALAADGKLIGPVQYEVAGTPCAQATDGRTSCFHRSGVREMFPNDPTLRSLGVDSYLGVPMRSSTGKVLGNLAIFHDGPIDESLDPETILIVFARRAGAELERIRRTQDSLRQRDLALVSVGYAAQRLLEAAHWQDCVTDILQTVGMNLETKRVLTTEMHLDANGMPRITVHFEWARDGVPRLMTTQTYSNFDMAREGYGRWYHELAAGRPIVGPEDLTPEENELMKAAGVLSTIQLPILVDGKLWGSISITDDKPRDWTQQDAHVLRAIPDGLGTAIQRERARDELLALNAELEARVSQRTAALDVANRELEAFCYSVSHDLRAPLRHIEGFAAALSDELLRDPAQARDLLSRLSEATGHMDQLINDLLELSRVTRSGMSREVVDLSELAGVIAEDLSRSAPQRRVDWKIASGISAPGDVALLRLALHNLLENAWKYTRQRDEARIEIGMTSTDAGELAIYVRDNGAGFDQNHADRLFGAFQRLHHPAEFEGHGIGLATVQRIVHRHGGRIWGEGRVGEGAVFRFMLPGARSINGPGAPARR